MPSLVHPREQTYFVVCLVWSALVYLGLLVSLIGILYLIVGAVIIALGQGLLVGAFRGNAVRVSETQFPDLHRLNQQITQQLNLTPPPVYVIQGGGLLNAFATWFFSRGFVVLYADVLELAYEEGEPAVAFVLCHELAHLKRRHVQSQWLIYPALLTPFVGAAYLRACEYTCDRYGAYYQPSGAAPGLLLLAAGKKLYRRVDAPAFAGQVATETGFWIRFAELLSSHPTLPKRVRAVEETQNLIRAQFTPVQGEGI